MISVRTERAAPEHLEHVSHEEAIEEWPEFKNEADHALDDRMNRLHKATGVNPDESARDAERNLVQSKRLAGGSPMIHGLGPGRKLPPGRHRYAGGQWSRWDGAKWVSEQVEE
jgi:hypothetical protein